MKISLILFAAIVAGAVEAAAQPSTAVVDREALVFVASGLGGYDDDITAGTATSSSNPRLRTGGLFAMTNLALTYARQGRRITFDTGVSASVRSYRAIERFTADTYGGSMVMSALVAPRVRFNANAAASRSSHFTLAILPVFTDNTVGPIEGPSLDFRLASAELMRYQSGAQLAYSPTRRSTATVHYGTAESSAGTYRLRSADWGAGYTHGVTRYASLRLGYRRQNGTFGGARRIPVESYDFGIDYGRPLSFSRRTTIRLGTGATAVEDVNRRYRTLIGHAGLHHQLSRRATLTIGYNRGMGFVEGFAEPTLTDTIIGTVEGHPHRRITLINTVGFANGTVGLHLITPPKYKTYSASVRAQFTLVRGLFAFTEYVLFHYHFDNALVLPFNASSRLNRQGVRSGVQYSVPIR